MDNFRAPTGARHFIALVTFYNKANDVGVTPSGFLVLAAQISRYFCRNPKGTRVGVRYNPMRDEGERFLEAWEQLR